MKFVIQWTQRPTVTVDDAERSMKVFNKWAPDPSVTFHQFVSRADGRGGFAVVEAENATALLRDATMFGAWFEFEAYPVVDMLDAAPIQQQVLDLILSV